MTLRRIALLLLALLALLPLALEGYYRWAHGPVPPKGHMADPLCLYDERLGYRLRPGAQVPAGPEVNRVNSLGFRGAEISLEKPPGVYRILCIGDSATNGANVHNAQTFPGILQALFDSTTFRNGQRVEVVNAGVPGYLSDHHRYLMKEKYLALSPDVVVFMMGVTDVSATLMQNDTWTAMRKPPAAQAPDGLQRLDGWLDATSAAYHWGLSQVRDALAHRRLTKNEKADLTKELSASLDLYEANFQAMAEACLARGVAVVNVNYPWNFSGNVGREDNFPAVKDAIKYYEFNLYWQAMPLLGQRNAKISGNNGLIHVDPQPDVLRSKDRLLFFGKNDFTHPSLQGNFLLAERVYTAIMDTLQHDNMVARCNCFGVTEKYLLGLGGGS